MNLSVKLIIMTWVAVAAVLMGGASGRKVTVGGKYGWNQGVNYTLWASDEKVYVGDWLSFVFDRYMYDVVEVNKTSYESCNAEHILANITRGAGRDVVQVNESRPYYFICTKGYCYGGMKVAINVSEPPAPTPSPTGNDGGLSIIAGSKSVPLLLLAFSVLLVVF